MPTCAVSYKLSATSAYPAETIRGYDDALCVLAQRHKGTELGSGYGFGHRDVVYEFKMKFHMKKFMKEVRNFTWVESVTTLNTEPVRE